MNWRKNWNSSLATVHTPWSFPNVRSKKWSRWCRESWRLNVAFHLRVSSSRTKEAMIKDVNEITEERYKRHDLHRLLTITQRFGVELDEIKRKEAAARKALGTNTSSTSKRKLGASEDEDENLDFSMNDDGFVKINKNGNSGHYNRFVKRKKRPGAFFARRNATAKRKRGGFWVRSNWIFLPFVFIFSQATSFSCLSSSQIFFHCRWIVSRTLNKRELSVRSIIEGQTHISKMILFSRCWSCALERWIDSSSPRFSHSTRR